MSFLNNVLLLLWDKNWKYTFSTNYYKFCDTYKRHSLDPGLTTTLSHNVIISCRSCNCDQKIVHTGIVYNSDGEAWCWQLIFFYFSYILCGASHDMFSITWPKNPTCSSTSSEIWRLIGGVGISCSSINDKIINMHTIMLKSLHV